VRRGGILPAPQPPEYQETLVETRGATSMEFSHYQLNCSPLERGGTSSQITVIETNHKGPLWVWAYHDARPLQHSQNLAPPPIYRMVAAETSASLTCTTCRLEHQRCDPRIAECVLAVPKQKTAVAGPDSACDDATNARNGDGLVILRNSECRS
jgi:hypothetical protein